MPWKAPPPCRIRSCWKPGSNEGLCDQHYSEKRKAQDANRPTFRERGYDGTWHRTVARAKRETPFCVWCGATSDLTGDHILPISLGGSNEPSNCRILCRSCNSKAGVQVARQLQQPGTLPPDPRFSAMVKDWERRRQSIVVHTIGQAASGKSWLLAELDRALGLPCFGIDDERTHILKPGEGWPADDLVTWVHLVNELDAHRVCGVETSGWSGNDRVLLQGRRVLTVLCTATDAVRRERLQARVTGGYRLAQSESDYVTKLLALRPPPVTADLTVDTSAPGALQPGVLDAVAAWLDREVAAAAAAHPH